MKDEVKLSLLSSTSRLTCFLHKTRWCPQQLTYIQDWLFWQHLSEFKPQFFLTLISVNTFKVTLLNTSLFSKVSMVLVFIVIGNLTSGYLSERFGRKNTLIIAVLVLILGWITLFFAVTFILVISSRCISGFGSGMAMPSAYMLLSEVSLLRLRGALGVCNILIVNVAFSTSLILAALLPFIWIIPLSAIPCFVFLLLAFFMPESPLWLVKRNRLKEAENILTWLRGEQYPISPEMKELIHASTQEADDITWQQKLQFLRTKPVIKPIMIMFAMFTMEVNLILIWPISISNLFGAFPLQVFWPKQLNYFLSTLIILVEFDTYWVYLNICGLFHFFLYSQASCGADLITFYSLDIIDKAELTFDAYLLSTLIKAGFLVGNIISTPLMSKVGRRPQFLLSTVLVALSMYTIALCMYVEVIISYRGLWHVLFHLSLKLEWNRPVLGGPCYDQRLNF